jgi:hypothetical protein
MALFSALGSLFNKELKLPTYSKVSQQTEQGNAIASNIANVAQAARLAEMTNTEQNRQQKKMIAGAVPGYEEANQLTSQNLLDALRGILPVELTRRIASKVAEQSGRGGWSGSGMAQNLNTAVTAETMLARADAAAPAFQRWSAAKVAMENPNAISLSSMFVSPQSWINNAIQENQFKYGADVQRKTVAYKTDPMTHLGSTIGGMADSVAGFAATGGFSELFSSFFGKKQPDNSWRGGSY